MAEPTAAVASTEADLLVVRTSGRDVALTVSSVVEVVGLRSVAPVPSRSAPLRGLMEVRSRLLPIYHLGATLAGSRCPEQLGQMAVVVAVGQARIALEVDYADSVRHDSVRLLPSENIPGSVGVTRQPEGFLPVVDSAELGRMLMQQDMDR